jgi:hypothetical protein
VALLIWSWALADFYLKKKKPKFISLMVLPLVNVLLILSYYLELVFPRHAIWLIFYSIHMVLCILIALKLMYLHIDFLYSSACFWSQKLIDHIMYCIFFCRPNCKYWFTCSDVLHIEAMDFLIVGLFWFSYQIKEWEELCEWLYCIAVYILYFHWWFVALLGLLNVFSSVYFIIFRLFTSICCDFGFPLSKMQLCRSSLLRHNQKCCIPLKNYAENTWVSIPFKFYIEWPTYILTTLHPSYSVQILELCNNCVYTTG